MIPYIFFFIILTLLVILYYHSLSRKYYIEKSLYQFRESKHQLIVYMGDNVKSLSDHDYRQLKTFLRLINRTIDHFSKAKGLSVSIKTVVSSTIQSNRKIEFTESGVTEPFVKLYLQGVGYSLEAIPLFRIRIFISLLRLIFSLLISFGLFSFKYKLSQIESFLTAEDNYNNQCLN